MASVRPRPPCPGPGAPARRGLRLAGGALMLAAGLAACGGSSPITASGGATTTAPGSPTTTTAPPQTTTTTTEPGSTTTTTTAGSGGHPVDAARVLRRALHDAYRAGWVRSDSTGGAAGSEAIITDAGPDRGAQTVIFNGLTGHIVVLPGRTYVHGTAPALQQLFRIPHSQATVLAPHWVVLVKADRQYHNVTIGVTLPSLLAPVALTGALHAARTSHNGHHYVLISGRVPAGAGYGAGASGRLAVTSGPDPLPYVLEIHTSGGGTFRWVFTRWGTKVPVHAPGGAVRLPAGA